MSGPPGIVNLPEGTTLSYKDCDVLWPAPRCWPAPRRREILIIAHRETVGTLWEIVVVQCHLPGPALQLRIFSDAWDVFTHIPGFFTALTTEKPTTLTELRAILNHIGAVNITPHPPEGTRTT